MSRRQIFVQVMESSFKYFAILQKGGTTDLRRSVVSNQSDTRAGATTALASVKDGLMDKGLETHNACGHVWTLCRERLKESLQRLDLLDRGNIPPSFDFYFPVLQKCINIKALAEGRQVHAHISNNGIKPSIHLGNVLVDMYAKCGSVLEAQEVFDKMSERNVVTWTMLIAGYTNAGHAEEAFKLFSQMEQEGKKPDEVTFVSILKACAILKALEQGKKIHSQIIKSGLKLNIFIGNTLIDMYAKCGSLNEAHKIFDNMLKRDVITWTVMILGYAQLGHGNEAFKIFQQMECEGMKPNKITFLGVLKACNSLPFLEKGREIHLSIMKNGFESDFLVVNTLIDMYSKCGCIEDAREVFDTIISREVVSWNVMISGYAEHNHDDEAFELFLQMEEDGVQPDAVTFISVLKACANQESLLRGKWLHSYIVGSGVEFDAFVGSTLVDMYAKCGSMENACSVFDKLVKGDVVPWNAVIAGHAQHGHGKEALEMVSQLQCEGVAPNETTFASALKACGSLADSEQGKRFHAYIMKSGFESTLVVENTLIDMYAKCGSVEEACKVFKKMRKRDVVSLNAMIAGYVEHGHHDEAFKVFWQMLREGIKPNDVTFVTILKACIGLAALEQGKQIHALVLESGMKANTFVGNTLVHMYAKCGSLEIARQVFDALPKKDEVSWAVMILNYTQDEQSEEAVKLYWNMEREGTKSNEVVYVYILRACTSLAALEQGKKIHAQLSKSGLKSCVVVENALIDMYAKCGSLEDAQGVFDKMLERDSASWTMMILNYAQHGHGKDALQFFGQMCLEDVKLDHVTFVGVLSACSHVGLLHEGHHFFESLSQNHGIIPTVDHYACMVDLLGRVGSMEEAVELVEKMPFQPSSVVWTALLGACRMHGNVKLAKWVAKSIVELEPQNSGTLVTLLNIYAAAGR